MGTYFTFPVLDSGGRGSGGRAGTTIIMMTAGAAPAPVVLGWPAGGGC